MGDSPVSIAYQHVGEAPAPPSRYVEGLSDDLDAVVLHALAKPRDARYQTAAEFRTDLQAVRRAGPSATRPAARPPPSPARPPAEPCSVRRARRRSRRSAPTPPRRMPCSPPPGGRTPAPDTGTFPGVGEEDEEKRNPAVYVLLAIAVLAAIAALGYGLFNGFGADEVPQVAVPQVVGDPEQTAVAKIAQATLRRRR